MIRFTILLVVFFHYTSNAQTKWINSGTIVFEQRTKIKDLGSKVGIPEVSPFITKYYTYYFYDNKSIYNYTGEGNKLAPKDVFLENQYWYNDYTQNQFAKTINFEHFDLLVDKQIPIKWKYIMGDFTEIAGFKCRKAMTILFDSVYVYAYYSDEITISGGPMSLHGLPGMILGVTIPRLNTSWIATSLSISIPKAVTIAPLKGTKAASRDSLLSITKKLEGYKGNRQSWSLLL